MKGATYINIIIIIIIHVNNNKLSTIFFIVGFSFTFSKWRPILSVLAPEAEEGSTGLSVVTTGTDSQRKRTAMTES